MADAEDDPVSQRINEKAKEMADAEDDPVSQRINEMVDRERSSPISPEVSIFKVPKFLREVNKKAYEPQLLAIGPYHREKSHLKAMEAHKIRYLKMILDERKEKDVAPYVRKMRKLEPRARKCYAERVSLGIGKDDFVEMMLLDGCFILQIIRMFSEKPLKDPNDFVVWVETLHDAVCWDMLLVENQLPFFVLRELFSMLEISHKLCFTQTVLDFLRSILPLSPREDWKPRKEIKHLVDFIHQCLHPNSNENLNLSGHWKFIRCATELQEAGMNFKMDNGNSFFDIRFEFVTGTIKIPHVKIGDNTERFLRNLVAFEQLYSKEYLHTFTDYIIFMDYLIESAKDVEILCQQGIIENMLGDNKAVATMFNKLGAHVLFDKQRFYYYKKFNEINKYYDRPWNKLIAYLTRNYFNSPWTPLVSVVAAFALLVLTLLQTIFSILS